MSEHKIETSEHGERVLESTAEDFGVEKEDVLLAKLKMRGVSKEIAAELFLEGKIAAGKAREYFDQDELEKLRESKSRLEEVNRTTTEGGSE